MNELSMMVDRAVAGVGVTREEAIELTMTPDDGVLALVTGAHAIRRRFHGDSVRIHVLNNVKSGLCPEDCAFCSQSVKYDTGVPRYKMLSAEQLVAGAERAVAAGATTYCMVTSTRGPRDGELDIICQATEEIRTRLPGVRVCASLGLLKDGQARRLRAAGVERYNHNLETSPHFFGEVVSTHRIEDRIKTVREAKAAGLEACCGGILGMGESSEDWVDLACLLRELQVESVPINFLDPRPGTPLADAPRLRPLDCLRALAVFRFILPQVDLRLAGGREVNLKTLQPLALFVVNSIFTEGYLTTPGASSPQDLEMIIEAGFVPAKINSTGGAGANP